MSYPPTVLRKSLAASRKLASEAQARGRGRTRDADAVKRRFSQSQKRVSNPSAGLRDMGPRRTAACSDAAMRGFMSVGFRLIPAVSSAAPGSPALLPEGHRHGSRAQAVWRCSMPETVRARWWAKRRRAWPLSCFFSTLARDVCPGSCPRRNRVAASEKAHVRGAVPLLCPDVPQRVPPDAFAPWTRRPDEAPSWPRGKRSIWCMS